MNHDKWYICKSWPTGRWSIWAPGQRLSPWGRTQSHAEAIAVVDWMIRKYPREAHR